jgi:predicted membrane protein (TIGR00267 family)
MSFSHTASSSLREIIFGLEDGLVSTLGAITGIAIATHDYRIVIISGLVIVGVESLSMAAGTYLSNKSQVESQVARWHFLYRPNFHKPKIDSLFMGISYILGGFIPLSVYFLLPLDLALPVSVSAAAGSLFLIGYIKGKLVHTNGFKSGLEMMTVSLSAAILGYLIGKFTSLLFPQITSVI